MTDLEITKLCEEAIGSDFYGGKFDPLHDDAQAMALVKKLWLDCTVLVGAVESGGQSWLVRAADGTSSHHDETLNRAICECAAKMQKAKND